MLFTRFGFVVALLASSSVLAQIDDEISPVSDSLPQLNTVSAAPETDTFWQETLKAFLETERYDLFQQKIQEQDVLKALSNEQLDAVIEAAAGHHFLFASMTDFFLRDDIVSRVPGKQLGDIFYKMIENNEYGSAAKIVRSRAFTFVPKERVDASLNLLAKKLQKRKLISFWQKKISKPNTGILFI